MIKKIVLVILISALLTGCGGSGTIFHPETVHASFPASQPLTCTGIVQTGIVCDESDGLHYYRHDQFTVAIGPDGHGTFQVLEEVGISSQTGLRQIQFMMPQSINIAEVHGTLTINSWCNGDGALSTWDSLSDDAPIKSIVGGKNYEFNAGEKTVFVIPQVVFPVPIRSTGLQLEAFTDLCASSTFHWVFNGSF
jgi:hypothetical protein